MIVVERPYIDRQHQFYKQFHDLSLLWINLYTHGKSYMRKHFFTSAFKVGSTRIIIQLSAILKPSEDSQLLPTKISNQVLKQILKQFVHNWEDCQKSRIAYDRELPRFSFFPSIPQYKHKNWGRKLLSHDNQSIEKRGGNKNNGLLPLSQNDIIISTKSPNLIKVRKGFATAPYFVEVANQKPITLVDLNCHLRAGIDLGIDHLVALASNNPKFTLTISDQKHLKSINQGFHQRRAFLLSNLLSKLDQGKSTTRPTQRSTFNRKKRLKNYLSQTSSLMVKRLVDEKIIQLIICTKVRKKQNIKLEKPHQNFVVSRHTQLAKYITYKTELVGIKVIVTKASYTNKFSFLDLEPVGKQESYQGNRGKRGWFMSFNESRINADVNAALNMIIKVNVNSTLEECHNPIYVFAVSPVRVDPVQKEPQKVG